MCVDKLVEDLKRSDCVASEKAGFKPYMLLAKHSDVTTWCKFTGSELTTMTANEKKVITKDNIILKTGVKWAKVEASEVGMIKVSTKKGGNAFNTEAKIRVQNSMESRGWVSDKTGVRLVGLCFETENTLPLLLGHSDGYYLEFKKDGIDAEFGEKYADDKYIDLMFEYQPLMPFNYAGTYEIATPVVIP